MDPNILHIEEAVLEAAKVIDKIGPTFVVRTMAHQINCVRNKDGEVTEGSPTEIRSVIYYMAFQQEIDEEEYEMLWKIMEFGVHPLDVRLL